MKLMSYTYWSGQLIIISIVFQIEKTGGKNDAKKLKIGMRVLQLKPNKYYM